jgi:hypothetical protein
MLTKKDAMLQFLTDWGKVFKENATLNEKKSDARFLTELRLMQTCANCIYVISGDTKRVLTDTETKDGIEEWIQLTQKEATDGVLNQHHAKRIIATLIEVKYKISAKNTEGVQASLF